MQSDANESSYSGHTSLNGSCTLPYGSYAPITPPSVDTQTIGCDAC